MTELNPSYPELAVTVCVLLLGVIDFDCKIGELPLDFTCIATLFGQLGATLIYYINKGIITTFYLHCTIVNYSYSKSIGISINHINGIKSHTSPTHNRHINVWIRNENTANLVCWIRRNTYWPPKAPKNPPNRIFSHLRWESTCCFISIPRICTISCGINYIINLYWIHSYLTKAIKIIWRSELSYYCFRWFYTECAQFWVRPSRVSNLNTHIQSAIGGNLFLSISNINSLSF